MDNAEIISVISQALLEK